MRIVTSRMSALFILLAAGLLSVALADTPAEPATSPAAPAAAPAATSAPASTATPAATSNAAAAPSTATTAAASRESDAALEKRLTNSGYKPKTRDGAKVWCKQQAELGSRLGAQQVCATPDEWRRAFRDNQDVVEQIQRVGSQPSGK